MQTARIYTEEDLVLYLKNKNEEAFSYLYDRYASSLNGLISRMIDEPAQADDLLQEIFMKIWNNFSHYDPSKGRLFTWMMRLTRNHVIDRIRSRDEKKHKRIVRHENYLLYPEKNIAEQYDTIGLEKQLIALTPALKRVIYMSYYYGYTQKEIAAELEIPLGTVKTKMRTAILQLRKSIVVDKPIFHYT